MYAENPEYTLINPHPKVGRLQPQSKSGIIILDTDTMKSPGLVPTFKDVAVVVGRLSKKRGIKT